GQRAADPAAGEPHRRLGRAARGDGCGTSRGGAGGVNGPGFGRDETAGARQMSGFASTTDLADKTISFEELAPGLYGYTAEGDPNSGVVIGDDSVLVVDAQATPLMAQDVIARVR